MSNYDSGSDSESMAKKYFDSGSDSDSETCPDSGSIPILVPRLVLVLILVWHVGTRFEAIKKFLQ